MFIRLNPAARWQVGAASGWTIAYVREWRASETKRPVQACDSADARRESSADQVSRLAGLDGRVPGLVTLAEYWRLTTAPSLTRDRKPNHGFRQSVYTPGDGQAKSAARRTVGRPGPAPSRAASGSDPRGSESVNES
ncbi:MAG: hypothetical protein QM766_17420 [Burkholderiaceae bacterium]